MDETVKGFRNNNGCKVFIYEDKGNTQIIGYFDLVWVGSPSNRRFTSQYCVVVGGNLILGKSKKQNIMVRSNA